MKLHYCVLSLTAVCAGKEVGVGGTEGRDELLLAQEQRYMKTCNMVISCICDDAASLQTLLGQ